MVHQVRRFFFAQITNLFNTIIKETFDGKQK